MEVCLMLRSSTTLSSRSALKIRAELSHISEHDKPMPYFILGDAFGIRTFLVKPYGQRNLQRDERI